jgi:hypothetical protein
LPKADVLETRCSIEQLLSRLKGVTAAPEKLRVIRAIETLETIGTAEARALLEDLARGAPAARLTQEARESCARLAQRAAEPRGR